MDIHVFTLHMLHRDLLKNLQVSQLRVIQMLDLLYREIVHMQCMN